MKPARDVDTYIPSATKGSVHHQVDVAALEEDDDGFWHPPCECGWRFAPVPDLEVFVDVLMAHAFHEGAS